MKYLMFMVVSISIFSCQEKTTSIEQSTSIPATAPEINIPTDSLEMEQGIKTEEDIRKAYKYLTSAIASKRLDSTLLNYNCKEEKKGTVTYFSEKGQLRVIKLSYSEYGHFSATETYFVKGNSLFFVLQQQVSWSFVDQDQTKDEVTENRVYLLKDQLVKCLQKNYTVYSNTKGNSAAQTAANQEIKCASLKPLTEKFNLLVNYKNRQQDLACLGD